MATQLNITDLVNQVRMIRLKAEALAAETRVLEETLVSRIRSAVEPKPEDNAPACTCPPNMRVAAATHGHASRTKCRKCGKEHD